MNPSCFVVQMGNNAIFGVEVEAGDQLTPDETRHFAKELLKAADKAERAMRKTWPKKVCTVEYYGSGYIFTINNKASFDGWYNSDELEALFLKHKITHVNSTFGDDKATPESPRKGMHTRDAYIRWWRTGEADD